MLIDKLNWLTSYLSGCTVRDKFNIYCPCCGGTRALKELLKLHIIKSLQYNPIVILTILYFILHIILLFIEYRFYHKYRFIKLRIIMIYIFFTVWMVFWMIRSFRVYYLGIDFLNNILKQ